MGRKLSARRSPRPDYSTEESDSPPSPPSPPPKKSKKGKSSFDRTMFIDSQAQANYAAYESYKFLLVRPVPLDAHPVEIVDIIVRHKWQRFMRPEVPCYPRVVRQFYANLELDEKNGILTTKVLGNTIRITEFILNRFYGFDSDPRNVKITKQILDDKWAAIKTTLNYDSERDQVESSKHLHPNRIHKLSSCSSLTKLLACLLQENLLQIGFHKSDWTSSHLNVVYYILDGYNIDTAHAIFSIMSSQLLPRSKCLPFANSICELLSQHFHLDLSQEIPGPKTYRFTPTALNLNEDDELTHCAPPFPPTGPSRSKQPTLAHINTRLDHIETTLSTLTKAVHTLTSSVKKISSAVTKLLKQGCLAPQQPSTSGQQDSDGTGRNDSDEVPLAKLPLGPRKKSKRN